MKLEPHSCDLCDEMLYVPDRSLHELTLKHLSQDDPEHDTLDWEICSECKDKFLKWIVEQNKAAEEKES